MRFEERLTGKTRQALGCAALSLLLSSPALAQSDERVLRFAQPEGPRGTVNTYGIPGLIDMPTALVRPDGELSFTSGYFGAGVLKNTISFQIAPRLFGSFRYSAISNFDGLGNQLLDRSFTLQYQLADETRYLPSVAVGLNDFLGTGVFSSEYVVLAKTLSPRLRVTGGIGWGRLGGVNGFTNPLGVLNEGFKTRPALTIGQGGNVDFGQFFRGDAAFFGGVEFQATDRLKLMLEYSSDAYPDLDGVTFNRRSPLNFGLTYAVNDRLDLSAHYLYGSEFGIQISYAIDPAKSRFGGGVESAPPPIKVRPNGAQAAQAWAGNIATQDQLKRQIGRALEGQGLVMHGIQIQASAALVELENPTYPAWSQAYGRAARVLAGILPASVERFTFISVINGLPTGRVSLNRSDLEALEFQFDNAWTLYTRLEVDEATDPLMPQADRYPTWDFKLAPYLAPALFDPDEPVRLDVGVEARARAEIAPGFVLTGTVRQRLLGNRSESTLVSDSVLPRVRSESYLYDKVSTTIPILTGTYFFRLGDDLYGRTTAGLLEAQYGGISAEVLWKPIDSRLALGVEVNYARQRGFDQMFDFRDYDIVTGHASAYYSLDGGYNVQVDAGRYLAGDWGTTLGLSRSFSNGIEVGAYATFTDVSFDEFGEGSFDKGISITIPLGRVNGQPSRDKIVQTFQPVLRDGGARLSVSDRLYDLLEDSHRPALKKTRGRFWR